MPCLRDGTPIMKTLLLAFVAFAFSMWAARADSMTVPSLTLAPVAAANHGSSAASIPPLTLAATAGTTSTGFKLDGGSNFAQLDTQPGSMPVSSGLVLALVAVFVLALRLMGLKHARAMADHERDSYEGKARMFRALHEGGADH
jgi:hypothetical protein